MLARVLNFRTEEAHTHKIVDMGGGEKRVVAGKPRLFMEIEIMVDADNVDRNEELLKSIGQSGMMRLSAPDGHVPEVVRKVAETKSQEVVERLDHW